MGLALQVSAPRTWAGGGRSLTSRIRARVNPTHKGRAGLPTFGLSRPKFHPHARGRGVNRFRQDIPSIVSSPRARAGSRYPISAVAFPYAIPTREGRGAEAFMGAREFTCHPHAQGWGRDSIDPRLPFSEPSPPARGRAIEHLFKHAWPQCQPRLRRQGKSRQERASLRLHIIPTHLGRGRRRCTRRLGGTYHPHALGWGDKTVVVASRQGWPRKSLDMIFIPALAGRGRVLACQA